MIINAGYLTAGLQRLGGASTDATAKATRLLFANGVIPPPEYPASR
jgi:hypothetical protein